MSTLRIRLGLVTAIGLVGLGAGCGLTCELQGVPHDYVDCDDASTALQGGDLTEGQKRDLRACVVESCTTPTDDLEPDALGPDVAIGVLPNQ